MAATASPARPATAGSLLQFSARFSPDLLSRLDVQAKRIKTTRGALLRALAARGLESMDSPTA
jgi:predicted DNA-binding protein